MIIKIESKKKYYIAELHGDAVDLLKKYLLFNYLTNKEGTNVKSARDLVNPLRYAIDVIYMDISEYTRRCFGERQLQEIKSFQELCISMRDFCKKHPKASVGLYEEEC